MNLLGEKVIDLKLCFDSVYSCFAKDPPLQSAISASFDWQNNNGNRPITLRVWDKGVSRTNQILSRETHPTQLNTIEETVGWCADQVYEVIFVCFSRWLTRSNLNLSVVGSMTSVTSAVD